MRIYICPCNWCTMTNFQPIFSTNVRCGISCISPKDCMARHMRKASDLDYRLLFNTNKNYSDMENWKKFEGEREREWRGQGIGEEELCFDEGLHLRWRWALTVTWEGSWALAATLATQGWRPSKLGKTIVDPPYIRMHTYIFQKDCNFGFFFF